jgi:hypothetical protein
MFLTTLLSSLMSDEAAGLKLMATTIDVGQELGRWHFNLEGLSACFSAAPWH